MPNTLRENVREKARKAINRRLEQANVTEAELSTAASDWDLSSYNAFFSDCREAGNETQRCGALWTLLKDRDLAPTGQPDADQEAADEPADAPAPALPVPETVEELETEFEDAENVFLLVTTGCPSCNQAKEALDSWISSGLVQIENIQSSDRAADIVLDTGLEALPALVMETDGEYIPV